MNFSWKHQYYESVSKELHVNVFRSLEIEDYCQKTLKDHGFRLQNCKINFSSSAINVSLSVCKLAQVNSKIEKFSVKKKEFSRKTSKLLISRKKFSEALNICRIYRLRVLTKIQQANNFTCLSNSILKSLKLFTQSKQDINLTINETNFVNSNKNTKQILKNLYKYQKTSFFEKGKKILAPFTIQPSAKLFGDFVATQIRMAKKQQNFFFGFLKESLNLMINQKFSRVRGIKITIKGRVNNAARSQTRTIKLGKISLISVDSKIDYAESVAFTSNGTIGIKIWVSM